MLPCSIWVIQQHVSRYIFGWIPVENALGVSKIRIGRKHINLGCQALCIEQEQDIFHLFFNICRFRLGNKENYGPNENYVQSHIANYIYQLHRYAVARGLKIFCNAEIQHSVTRPFGWNILLQRTFTNRFVKLYKYVIEYSSTEWSHKSVYVVTCIHTCKDIYMAVSMYTTNMCKDVLYHY